MLNRTISPFTFVSILARAEARALRSVSIFAFIPNVVSILARAEARALHVLHRMRMQTFLVSILARAEARALQTQTPTFSPA